MTTTTRNEAAERLHTAIYRATGGSTHSQRETIWRQRIDEALAAERRATVERIRERLAGMEGGAVLLTVPSFAAILDEEAAR